MNLKKISILFLCYFISTTAFSQFKQKSGTSRTTNTRTKDLPVNTVSNDSINRETKIILSGKTKYTDYRYFSRKKDTLVIDTTLTIKKHYAFNFLRKDNFELLEFPNQGQTFNSLGYNFSENTYFPEFGFNAKHFNYQTIDDINYYKTPTPTTEAMYRGGIEQGQVLDIFFSSNFSKRLNVTLAYKGLRSLGAYRNSLVSSGNFTSSFNYLTKSNRYTLKGHITTQDLSNQENGGLTPVSVNNFSNDDPNFSTRGRLDVKLEDAESLLDGKRYYFDHSYKLFVVKDTTSQSFTNLKIGHTFTHENKFFKYKQKTASPDIFGETNVNSNIENTVDYNFTNNKLYTEFNSKYVLGTIRVNTNLTQLNYGYKKLYTINTNTAIPIQRINSNAVSFGADWKAKIKGFSLQATTNITPGSGRLAGEYLSGNLQYEKDSLFKIKANVLISSKKPSLNKQLYLSNYQNYNWSTNFDNVQTQHIGGEIDSKWGKASVSITNIANYTYFGVDSLPKQAATNVAYLKIKASKEFTFGKFALDNTVLYQNVSSGSSVFRVPELVTRNTLYYSDHWFKGNPLFVQIGTTLKYFSKYKANAYNPLLGEFQIQNQREIGHPNVDVFLNARVRRTRIYFKVENALSGFSSKNYFSAPNTPSRDLTIRFGVVWNWFI